MDYSRLKPVNETDVLLLWLKISRMISRDMKLLHTEICGLLSPIDIYNQVCNVYVLLTVSYAVLNNMLLIFLKK